MIKKVCDIQQEIRETLPKMYSMGLEQAIHDRQWDKAEDFMGKRYATFMGSHSAIKRSSENREEN